MTSLSNYQQNSPAANDRARHAKGAGLLLSPMADHLSPSTAASVFAPPGPFDWPADSMALTD